jgi:SAM-dependent methyltransferase
VASPDAVCEARSAYDATAPFYDEFTANHDYEKWLGSLLPAAERLGLRGARLLDLGCGTGKSFLPLLERGWEVTACDISPGMLERAKAKVGEGVRLELADIRALPRFGEFDLILCLDDCVNYLLSREQLKSCLIGARRNLAPGGLLIFDTNTLLSFRTFFASSVTVKGRSGRIVWQGGASPSMSPGSTIEATLELIGDRGARSEAAPPALHRQHHFPPREVCEALVEADLDCRAVFGHGLDAQLEQPLDEARHTKAIFIARAN